MKRLYILIICLLASISYSQEVEKYNTEGFTTIGYFSSKDVIAVKCKVLKMGEYTFLQIVLDDELYGNGSNWDIEFSFNGVTLTPISNEVDNMKVHLIFLDDYRLYSLKEQVITEIEVSSGYSNTFSIKNIKDKDFFKNNL